MLIKLVIKNLAIIKDLELDFNSGLNVITGETGAGKSMLIDALELLSGGRASVEAIREGESFCQVQGVFEIAKLPKTVLDFLRANDIESGDEEFSIRRIIYKEGKSRAYINNTLVTQGFLFELGHLLISILSQHEHQQLFHAESQLELLDRFINSSKLIDGVRTVYSEWKELQLRYDKLLSEQSDIAKKTDYLRYQINEISEHNFKPEEEEELKTIVARADNSFTILKTLNSLKEQVSSPDDSVSSRLSVFIPELLKCKSIEPDTEKLLELINDVTVKLDDLAELSYNISKKYDFDEEDVEYSRTRLSEIKRLKKKFACGTVEELLDIYQKMKTELEALDNIDGELEALSKNIEKLKTEYEVKAKELSEYRKKNSIRLSSSIENILSDLGMFKGGFHILFSEAKPSLKGSDRVDYLISTNPGEPVKPISRIASGGELSRLMLAVQSATNKVYAYGIQVFDEVDAGIGGDIGFKVGGLLKNIAKDRQLIVISHLPQLAVFAENHIKVWKEEHAGRTEVRVEPLSSDKRFNEITRMLGMENHKTAVSSAKEMVFKAQNYVNGAK